MRIYCWVLSLLVMGMRLHLEQIPMHYGLFDFSKKAMIIISKAKLMHHVPSKINAADCLTKGTTLDRMGVGSV